MTWPTISRGVRLRTRRCVPVWQKVQVSVQPTCEETHSVPRSSSGMWTVSTSCAVGEAQQPFAGAVDRDQGTAISPAGAARSARQACRGTPWPGGHRREIGDAAMIDPVPQLARAERLGAERGHLGGELRAAQADEVAARRLDRSRCSSAKGVSSGMRHI